MILMLVAWALLLFVFSGFSGIYYLYMRRQSSKPWNLKLTESYDPSISIIVPVCNEEKTIRFKLENLCKVNYPSKKFETILVNDASTDKTIDEINEFVSNNDCLDIKVLSRTEREGKTRALNFALKHATGDVIVVSDADCFLHSDILIKALPYLSDPTVGAITARELLFNSQSSWVTVGEQFFDNTVQSIRIGESKVHSTIFFQGGFAAYKRKFLQEFNHETDDSGTAFDVVQRNSRSLLIPEVGFYTIFPTDWKSKITLKIRRANQLQRLWIKSLKLLVNRKLKLPKKIAVPELFLHLFNPVLFVVLGVISVFVFMQYPVLLAAFLVMLCPALLIRKTRTMLIEVIQNNCILLAALTTFVTSSGFKLWKTSQEARSLITEDMLKEKGLI
ncbi:MAG: glycosyltransferase [Candidatus Bathyarchaeota archaeon]|nr:glycosyltransferase [Candidatus Bathyarchaeum sp.]